MPRYLHHAGIDEYIKMASMNTYRQPMAAIFRATFRLRWWIYEHHDNPNYNGDFVDFTPDHHGEMPSR